MKTYQVFYWIKKNGREYLNHMYVAANAAKEATQVCKQQVREQTGRNAFRPTTKAPDLIAYKATQTLWLSNHTAHPGGYEGRKERKMETDNLPVTCR